MYTTSGLQRVCRENSVSLKFRRYRFVRRTCKRLAARSFDCVGRGIEVARGMCCARQREDETSTNSANSTCIPEPHRQALPGDIAVWIHVYRYEEAGARGLFL